MNGDQLQPGEYSVSTSNRNSEGRQGKGVIDELGYILQQEAAIAAYETRREAAINTMATA